MDLTLAPTQPNPATATTTSTSSTMVTVTKNLTLPTDGVAAIPDYIMQQAISNKMSSAVPGSNVEINDFDIHAAWQQEMTQLSLQSARVADESQALSQESKRICERIRQMKVWESYWFSQHKLQNPTPTPLKQHIPNKRKMWDDHLKKLSNGKLGCTLCDRTFSERPGFTKHFFDHHIPPQFLCSVCGKRYKRQYQVANCTHKPSKKK